MPEHEHKQCPRCHSDFECKVGSIHLCQCSDIVLTEDEQMFIGLQYNECLCISCLRQLRAEYHNTELRNTIKKILGIFYKE